MIGWDRFWRRVLLGDGCWEWTGWKNTQGYGVVYLGGGRQHPKHSMAHRAAWALWYEPIPEDICVLHRCDNPGCVRPDHLFLGTKTDNHRDMTSKGRHYNQVKTHCPRGHEYDRVYAGQRHCRTCMTENQRRYMERKRAAC